MTFNGYLNKRMIALRCFVPNQYARGQWEISTENPYSSRLGRILFNEVIKVENNPNKEIYLKSLAKKTVSTLISQGINRFGTVTGDPEYKKIYGFYEDMATSGLDNNEFELFNELIAKEIKSRDLEGRIFRSYDKGECMKFNPDIVRNVNPLSVEMEVYRHVGFDGSDQNVIAITPLNSKNYYSIFVHPSTFKDLSMELPENIIENYGLRNLSGFARTVKRNNSDRLFCPDLDPISIQELEKVVMNFKESYWGNVDLKIIPKVWDSNNGIYV